MCLNVVQFYLPAFLSNNNAMLSRRGDVIVSYYHLAMNHKEISLLIWLSHGFYTSMHQ